jgi:hypothetical protein
LALLFPISEDFIIVMNKQEPKHECTGSVWDLYFQEKTHVYFWLMISDFKVTNIKMTFEKLVSERYVKSPSVMWFMENNRFYSNDATPCSFSH